MTNYSNSKMGKILRLSEQKNEQSSIKEGLILANARLDQLAKDFAIQREELQGHLPS